MFCSLPSKLKESLVMSNSPGPEHILIYAGLAVLPPRLKVELFYRVKSIFAI